MTDHWITRQDYRLRVAAVGIVSFIAGAAMMAVLVYLAGGA